MPAVGRSNITIEDEIYKGSKVEDGICVLVASDASLMNVSAHVVSRLFHRITVRGGGAITSSFTMTIAIQTETTSVAGAVSITAERKYRWETGIYGLLPRQTDGLYKNGHLCRNKGVHRLNF